MSTVPDNNSNLTQVAAALTAVIGVFAGLAVTGVIGQAQRNHGLLVVVALGFVLTGAVLWLGATFPDQQGHRTTFLVLRGAALATFVAGLVIGILAIWFTQKESERPSVSSSYDPKTKVLALRALAHGMRTDSRLVVLVSGFNGTPDSPIPDKDPPTLYYAVVGPNADGDVDHTVSVPVPTRFTLVGVKAWTGKEPTACSTVDEESVIAETAQHDRVGCLLLEVR